MPSVVVNNGWAVANTTLMFERAGLGAGAGGAASTASPGTVAGDLDRRVGDFVGKQPTATRARATFGGGGNLLIELAKANGKIHDPLIRQDLMRLHILNEIARQTNQRAKALRAQGKEIPGMGNMGKLAMSQILRLSRDVGLRIVGPYGTLHSYTDEGRAALADATHQPYLPVGHRGSTGRARPVDLRRHRRDPAQHHRRACARPPERAEQRQDDALPRPPEELALAIHWRVSLAERDNRATESRKSRLGTGRGACA